MTVAVDASEDKLKLPAFNIFVIGLVVLVGLYYPSVESLLVEWDSSLYSHGWLVAAVFIYHLYRKTAMTPMQSTLHRVPGLLVIAGSAAIWWLSSITNILTLQFLALYGLVFGLIWCLWGWGMLLNLRYMLIALALAMPLWQVLQEPLRTLTTHVSYQFVQLTGVPVLLDNYMLTLPGGRFHVERACAGLSFVLTGTSLVFIFAAWQNLRFKALARLLVLSTLIAILANWIRVITIVLVGNYTNMQSDIVEDHRAFGWVLFAVVYCPFLWIYVRKLSSRPEMTVQDFSFPGATAGRQGYLLILLMFACLCVLPVVHSVLSGIKADPLMPSVEQVVAAEFNVEPDPQVVWRPALNSMDVERSYLLQPEGAALYLGENLSFAMSSRAVGANTTLVDEENWKVEKESVVDKVGHVVVRGGNRYRVIAYTFIMDGKRVPTVAGARRAKLSGYFSLRPNLLVMAIMKERLLHEDTDVTVSELGDVLERLSSRVVSQGLQ